MWQVLRVLLTHKTIPTALLQGSLATQVPPYPTVIASQELGKTNAEFWSALEQQLKPSLNYVITLALFLDDLTAPLGRVVEDVTVDVDHIDNAP